MNRKKAQEVLTVQEIKVLMEQPNTQSPTGQRNKLILEVFLTTGIRLSELTSLKWDNVRFFDSSVKVLGKGKKERIIPIREQTTKKLERWKERQIEITREVPQFVFTTLEGKALNKRYVREMVYRYTKKSGLKKSIHPHTFRHTFITDLNNRGVNLKAIQDLVGHLSLATTERYLRTTPEQRKQAVQKCYGGAEW